MIPTAKTGSVAPHTSEFARKLIKQNRFLLSRLKKANEERGNAVRRAENVEAELRSIYSGAAEKQPCGRRIAFTICVDEEMSRSRPELYMFALKQLINQIMHAAPLDYPCEINSLPDKLRARAIGAAVCRSIGLKSSHVSDALQFLSEVKGMPFRDLLCPSTEEQLCKLIDLLREGVEVLLDERHAKSPYA